MPSRRSVVANLATLPAVAVALAGCMDPDEGAPGAGAPTTSTDATPTHEVQRESRGPVQAENDVEPVVREVVDDSEIQTNETGDVRYVAGYRHANHEEMQEGEPPEREPVWETTPWEDWAPIQAKHVAAGEAARYLESEHGVEDVEYGSETRREDREARAFVATWTELDREDEVVRRAPVPFEELRAITPRSVDVTYVLEDREYETTEPIYVRHGVGRLQ